MQRSQAAATAGRSSSMELVPPPAAASAPGAATADGSRGVAATPADDLSLHVVDDGLQQAATPDEQGELQAAAKSVDLRLIINKMSSKAKLDREAGGSGGGNGDASGSGSGTGPRRPGGALASKASLSVMQAAAEAISAAKSLDESDGRSAPRGSRGARAPRRPRVSNSKFAHLPVWRRLPARWAHHWRVFRQQVDEDPEYADAVAHK
jgi:hypothetical protein